MDSKNNDNLTNSQIIGNNDNQPLKNTVIIPIIGMASTKKKDELCYAVENEIDNDKSIVSKDTIIAIEKKGN